MNKMMKKIVSATREIEQKIYKEDWETKTEEYFIKAKNNMKIMCKVYEQKK
jgi:hypothetical protein